MNNMYIVQVQGYGNKEDQFCSVGVYSTRAKAEATIEKLLVGWEADGGNRDEIVYEIEEHILDA